MYHKIIISPNGRSVSGHVAPLTILCIHEFLIYFDTVLFHFLHTGTSDKYNIVHYQLPKFLGFILYPLSVYLISPFNE